MKPPDERPDDFHLDEIKKLRAEIEKLEAYWILMEQGKASSAAFKQSLKDIARISARLHELAKETLDSDDPK